MDSPDFLYDSEYDKAVRAYGSWPYFVLYGAIFFLLLIIDVPAPFEVAVVAHHERTMSASVWAFLASYPLLHLGMKSRLLKSFNTLKGRSVSFLCAVVIFVVCWLPLHFGLPDDPATRSGRLLSNSPLAAALLLAALSVTASLGAFVVLEPLRARVARWL